MNNFWNSCFELKKISYKILIFVSFQIKKKETTSILSLGFITINNIKTDEYIFLKKEHVYLYIRCL